MNNAQLSVLGRQTSATTTILVIDEQLLVSSALAYSLRDLGFDAHSIRADLHAVKTAALAHPPGLVLLDLDLGSSPDGEPLDGIDLIAPLRAQGWTVLMITGTASLDLIADAIAPGAASWIVKGATFDELVHAAVEIMRPRDPPL
jgi:two-component system nitrate/nitrite response regulator NarL